MYAIRSYYARGDRLLAGRQVQRAAHLGLREARAERRDPALGVITSYSIHYTKLYELVRCGHDQNAPASQSTMRDSSAQPAKCAPEMTRSGTKSSPSCTGIAFGVSRNHVML